MSFRIGLVGLCTSHPSKWVPIIRELVSDKIVDCEVVAAWDSGETRPAGFAAQFCRSLSIPHTPENLEDMLQLVDGVIIHTANWQHHLEQARLFIEAGKSVFIDKPIVGNMRDVNQLLAWLKQGYRITGGSALRFTAEVKELLQTLTTPEEKIHTVYSFAGMDDFNYGIHTYSLVSQIMGSGLVCAQYLCTSGQKQILLEYQNSRSAVISVGTAAVLPFNFTAASKNKLYQMKIDNTWIYHSLLKAVLPYLTNNTDSPPISNAVLLEPELAALAAKTSWLNNGQKVFLSDLRLDDAGYDGDLFAVEYCRSKIKKQKEGCVT